MSESEERELVARYLEGLATQVRLGKIAALDLRWDGRGHIDTNVHIPMPPMEFIVIDLVVPAETPTTPLALPPGLEPIDPTSKEST